MSEKVLCEKSDLVAIADAVREATGSTENYNVSELSAATVEAISNANLILQDKTVSPTALEQIITPDSNYGGLSQVIVKGDADLKAENITEGITIFDVAGSNPYEKTATDTEINTQANLIAQITTALEGKAAGGGSGGSVGTCSLNIVCNDGSSILTTIASIFKGGIFSTAVPTGYEYLTSLTIDNIICGTSVYIAATGLSMYGCTISGGGERATPDSGFLYPNEILVKMPTEAGATVTVTVYNND